MLFIQERKPSLNVQSDSIRAKLSIKKYITMKHAQIRYNLFKLQLFHNLDIQYFFTLYNDVWYMETSSLIFLDRRLVKNKLLFSEPRVCS